MVNVGDRHVGKQQVNQKVEGLAQIVTTKHAVNYSITVLQGYFASSPSDVSYQFGQCDQCECALA